MSRVAGFLGTFCWSLEAERIILRGDLIIQDLNDADKEMAMRPSQVNIRPFQAPRRNIQESGVNLMTANSFDGGS
jgi:hypothetical protein